MSRQLVVEIWCFEQELGKMGYDEENQFAFFQYNPEFLNSNKYVRLFPLIFKRTDTVQVFKNFNNKEFRGLPPMIADSLPDLFGNIIFNKWLEHSQDTLHKIGPLEQLTYLANRGMGALEYKPVKKISKSVVINFDEIIGILKQVLDQKNTVSADQLDHTSLLTIFKIGTSAGGLRPKILVSENKKTGKIIPGDVEYSELYRHYLVKLTLEDALELDFYKGKIEYAYYLLAKRLGITMMESKLIQEIHFATERFDRISGKKIHVLSASGLTGWSHEDASVSSYENLFELAYFLKIQQVELDELFKRMVFNWVFFNIDDHLKNHSFCYSPEEDSWHLSPAYDITYPVSLKLNRIKTNRSLAINGKRNQIGPQDLLVLAEKYAIKSPEKTINLIQSNLPTMLDILQQLAIPNHIIQKMQQDFVR